MLSTLGGRFGGWGMYLLKGKPVFTYNLLGLERFRWEGSEALTPGKHTIVFDFKYDGPGMAKPGSGALSVDGKEVAEKTIPHTVPARFTIDESFDVGSRYPDQRGRQGLPTAVPVHRQARQTDDQTGRTAAVCCGGEALQRGKAGCHKCGAINLSIIRETRGSSPTRRPATSPGKQMKTMSGNGDYYQAAFENADLNKEKT